MSSAIWSRSGNACRGIFGVAVGVVGALDRVHHAPLPGDHRAFARIDVEALLEAGTRALRVCAQHGPLHHRVEHRLVERGLFCARDDEALPVERYVRADGAA
jgi:hypothetical protein